MSAQPKVKLVSARWSSAVRCQRKAFYEYQDAPKTPPSDQMVRWWRRGKAVEAAMRGAIFDELRADNQRPRAEEVIPWGEEFGFEGHLDAYVPADRHAIEIKSNGEAALTEYAALQVAGYAIHHPRAERASVLAVDSNSFQERWWPIDVAGLEQRVRAIEETVVTACRSGEAPERVCQHPHDTQAMFCQFVDHCFSGWEWPIADVSLDPEIVDLVDLLGYHDQEVSEARSQLRRAEAERDQVRDRLRPRLPTAEELVIGEYRYKRSSWDQQSFSLADCRKTGFALPDELEPFVSTSPWERWSLRKVAG